MAEELAQLVLRRDHGHLGAGRGECRQDGADPQVTRVIHHDFLAALRIEEVIAADPMHGRRHTGHDGQIVGIGEARHDAVGDETGAGACEQSGPERARRPRRRRQ